MEVVYLMLVCAVCVAHVSKGVAYDYQPVYDKAEDTDYAPGKMYTKRLKTQGVSYYYPPVYGDERDEGEVEEQKHVYIPSYLAPEDILEEEAPQGKAYYVKKPYTRRIRTYYKRPSYRTMRALQIKKAREARKYEEEEETAEAEYYREPEQKSYPKKRKTMKCLQCEYSPPKKIEYEVLVREPKKVQVPREIEECTWEKNIDYVYVEPHRGSKHMYGRYKEVPKYQKICFPKTIYETKTVYRSRYIKKQKWGQAGGFKACRGPLTAYTAEKFGVDDWDCHNNCYVKKDKSGTIVRGCYSGQYKVDPNRLGCHYQGDNKQDIYCFCKGDHCNGKSVPTRQ